MRKRFGVLQAALLGMLLLVTAEAGAAQEPLVTAPRVAQAPTVDGTLAPGEWDAAALVCGWRNSNSGFPARAETLVYVCWNAQALYVAYECFGEDPGKLASGGQTRDSAIWNGSEVELFLAPEPWPITRYAHFMLDHAGAVADELCSDEGRDLTWNPDWQYATGKTADRWVAEMTIPWASVEAAAPAVGTRLRANFCRAAPGAGELMAWAPVLGEFHQPERFGTLVLGGPETAVRIAELPKRTTGPFLLTAQTPGQPRPFSLTITLTPAQGRPRVEQVDYEGGGGLEARMAVEIPDGTRQVTVEARGPGQELWWAQTVELNLPPLTVGLERVQRELDQVRGLAALTAQREALAARAQGLRTQAAGPLDTAGLAQAEQALASLESQAQDLALLAAATPPGGPVPAYLLTAPVVMDKIQPTGSAPGPPAERLYLAMCRNEYEPAQLVVTAVGRNLARVRMSATALQGPGSATIPAERVVVTPLGFVTCAAPSPTATLRGRVPDVLLPNRSMEVPAGQRQPFFVTVQSLATDQPGEYRGAVWVRAQGCAPQRVPLVVRIYRPTLPVKSHLRTAFCLQNGAQHFPDPAAPPGQEDLILNYARVMLTYRLSPITWLGVPKNADGLWDFSYVDKLLGDLVPRGLTTYNLQTWDFTWDPEPAKAMADHLKAKGWGDLAYLYGWDEVGGADVSSAQNLYKRMLAGAPDVKIMQTGGSLGSPEFDGLVKIWCPLTPAGANQEKTRAVQAQGEEVWWYVCCGPLQPYANLFVDLPGIEHRILGWQTYQWGLQGFLYWGVDVWTGNNPPVEQYDAANYANWNPQSFSTWNGDGYLLYPARGNQPIPSVRLALLRDGFEDYDLFKEVETLAAAHPGPVAERARKLLDLRDITPTLTDYTKDGNVLLARREALLQVAEELAGAGH